MYTFIVKLSNGTQWEGGERSLKITSEAACLAGEREANAYIMRNGLNGKVHYVVEVKKWTK